MSTLLEIYVSRLKGLKFETEADLENLYVTDEKSFYFVLMYFYLTGKNLGDTIRFNIILSNAVSLFCESCNDENISNYFSKYTDITETSIQIKKIYMELKVKGE